MRPWDRIQCEYCKGWGLVGFSTSMEVTIATLTSLGWARDIFKNWMCSECRDRITNRRSPLLQNPNEWIH